MSLWATGGSWSQSLPKLCHVFFKDYPSWNPQNMWSQQGKLWLSAFYISSAWLMTFPVKQEPMTESVFLTVYPDFPNMFYSISILLWSVLTEPQHSHGHALIPGRHFLESGCLRSLLPEQWSLSNAWALPHLPDPTFDERQQPRETRHCFKSTKRTDL